MIPSTSSNDAMRTGPNENYDFKNREGKVAITIQSVRADFDEKAEVLVHLDNPEYVVEKMLQTLANRFPPESVLTIEPRDAPIRDESTTSSMKAKHDSRTMSVHSRDRQHRSGDYSGYDNRRGGDDRRQAPTDSRGDQPRGESPSRGRSKRYQISVPSGAAHDGAHGSRERPRRVHSSRSGMRQPQDWQRDWKSSSSVASSDQRGAARGHQPHRADDRYSVVSSSRHVDKVSDLTPYDDMHRVAATASPHGQWLSPEGIPVRTIPPNSSLLGPDGRTVGRLTHDATHVSQEGLSLYGRLPHHAPQHHDRDSYESVGTVDGVQHAERKAYLDGIPEYDMAPRTTVDPSAEIMVRYVEVPVVQEVIKEVRVEEIREVEKRVPKYDIEYQEKIVEVPHVQYIDKYVEVEQIQEVIKPVPKIQIIEVPREYYNYVPKIVGEKTVEKIIEIPQMVEVPKPYLVPQPVPKAVPVTREVETLVAQTLRPLLVCDESECIEVGVRQFIPKVVCVDVYIPKPINTPLKPLGKLGDSHRIVDVPTPQYNSLVQHMNPHLAHPHELKGAGETLQLRRAMDGSFPVLLPHEKISVITPQIHSGGPHLAPTSENLKARSAGGDGVARSAGGDGVARSAGGDGVARGGGHGQQRGGGHGQQHGGGHGQQRGGGHGQQHGGGHGQQHGGGHGQQHGGSVIPLKDELSDDDVSGGSTEAGGSVSSDGGEWKGDTTIDRSKRLRKSLGASDEPLNYDTVYQTVLGDKYHRKSKKSQKRSKSQKRQKSKSRKSTKQSKQKVIASDDSKSSAAEESVDWASQPEHHRSANKGMSSSKKKGRATDGAPTEHRSRKPEEFTQPRRGDRSGTAADEDRHGGDRPSKKDRRAPQSARGPSHRARDRDVQSSTSGQPGSSAADGYASTKDLPWDLPFPQPIGTVNVTIPVTLSNNPPHPVARAADGTTIHVPVLKDSTKKGKKKINPPPPLVATLTSDQYRKKLKALGAGASTISSAIEAGRPTRQVTAPSRSADLRQQYHNQQYHNQSVPQSVPLYPSTGALPQQSVPLYSSTGAPMSTGLSMGGMPSMMGMPAGGGGMPAGGGGMPSGMMGMPAGAGSMPSMMMGMPAGAGSMPSMMSMTGYPMMQNAGGVPMTSTSYV